MALKHLEFLFIVLLVTSIRASCPRPRTHDPWSISRVVLDKVRRCTKPEDPRQCPSTLTRNDYEPFTKSHEEDMQKSLYISQVNSPPREVTNNIVFVVAGQQVQSASLREFGAGNGLTGQRDDFAKGFGMTSGSVQYQVRSSSLVNSILGTGRFSKTDTFVALVFDARFHYNYKFSTKRRIVDAYVEYLLSKLEANATPRTIYLAGHSRGGCLVMRLAAKLTSKFPTSRVIVDNYDGVCTVQDSLPLYLREFGVTKEAIDNPVVDDPDYSVRATDISARFPRKECLQITTILSGESIAIPAVHAFGHKGFRDQFNHLEISMPNKRKREWYRQSFHDYKHTEITFFRHNESVNNFNYALSSMPCKCGGADEASNPSRH